MHLCWLHGPRIHGIQIPHLTTLASKLPTLKTIVLMDPVTEDIKAQGTAAGTCMI